MTTKRQKRPPGEVTVKLRADIIPKLKHDFDIYCADGGISLREGIERMMCETLYGEDKRKEWKA